MSEEELASLQRQVQRERTARKEAERLLEEKSLALYRANQQLQRESDRNQRYLDTVQTIMLALDTAGRITMVNRAGCAMLGQPERALVGKAWFECFLPQPAGVSIVLPLFLRLVAGDLQAGEKLSEYPILDCHAQPRLIAWRNATLTDTEGQISGILSSGEDITERKQLEEELKRQAHIDMLTGLNNRRYFFELADQELARAKRHGAPLTALMLDLDHFKLVNDTYGHQVGDLVLKRFSEVGLKALRRIDILGRIGGEEFAILLPQTAGEPAREVAERLRLAVAAATVPLAQGTAVHLTVSIGLASFMPTDAQIADLLNRADTALYAAKNTGRNRVCCEVPAEATTLNKTRPKTTHANSSARPTR